MTRGVRAATAALAIGWIGALHAATRGVPHHPGAPSLLSETGLYRPSSPARWTPRIARSLRSIRCGPTAPRRNGGSISPPVRRSTRRTRPTGSFPVGTRFWKEFSFDGRKVETRLIWHATADRWSFATYVWNQEQTDAVWHPTKESEELSKSHRESATTSPAQPTAERVTGRSGPDRSASMPCNSRRIAIPTPSTANRSRRG